MKGDKSRDWSKFQSELLVSVAEHLRLADIARLPAVCGGWAWALGRLRRGLSPPTTIIRTASVPLENSSPWLLLPNEDGVDAEYRDFLRLSKCKSGIPRIRISPLPEMAGRICIGGSPDGWIVTLDIWYKPRILNPLTREEFLLPSIFNLYPYNTIHPTYSDQGDGSLSAITFNHPFLPPSDSPFEKFKYKYVEKIILSSSPPLGIAFLIHDRGYLEMARVGDLAWTSALNHQKFGFPLIQDVVYNEKDGKFYAITHAGKVIVLDLENYRWGSFRPPKATFLSSFVNRDFLGWKKYITFSSNGDLLQACVLTELYSVDQITHMLERTNYDRESNTSPSVSHVTQNIEIFKFDRGLYDGKNIASCWVHVKDLGDDAMFLGLSYSTCLTTSDKSWLRKNSVYFVEDTFFFKNINLREFTCDGGIFDLKDKKIERFFPSHSKVNWPLPAWFFPSCLQLVL